MTISFHEPIEITPFSPSLHRELSPAQAQAAMLIALGPGGHLNFLHLWPGQIPPGVGRTV